MDDDGYNQPNKNRLEGWVYVLDYGDGQTFKIGHTINQPEKRLAGVLAGLPVIMPKVELVMAGITTANCRYLEELLHMQFDAQHVKGEWFKLRFIDLVEIYLCLQAFGSVDLYDRWYSLVPEGLPEDAKAGKLNHLSILPFFTKQQEAEQWEGWQGVFDYLKGAEL